MAKKRYTEETDREIARLYVDEGQSTRQIGKALGFSQPAVCKSLHRSGVEMRGHYNHPCKYPPNEEFFATIQTENQAYFLGLMYADGNVCIHSKGYTASIFLQEEDKHILESFRDLISPLAPINFRKGATIKHKDQYGLLINSKTVVNQLIELGCVPDKSLILEYIDNIPNDLFHHFIRGYFDGDGSIKFRMKDGLGICSWDITSSDRFCKSIKDKIEYILDINLFVEQAHDNGITTRIVASGVFQAQSVFDWMYKDATIFLKRKYDKYIEFKSYMSTKVLRRGRRKFDTKESMDEMKRLYAIHKSTATVSEILGCSPMTVWKKLKEAGVELMSRGGQHRSDDSAPKELSC